MSVKTFRVQEPHPDVPQEFWAELSTHATRTAKIASKLPLEKEPLDIAVSAAFLHELGDLVVAGCMPSKFKQISVHAREKGWKTFQAEEEILGFSHAEIGAYLLGIWGLPTSIVETIEHHHHPDRVPHNRFDPTLAVYVADLLSRDLSELTPYDQACLEKLSLTGQFEEWAKSLPQDALSAGA
jgi:HD-like signal output (HDOD) protein